MPIFRFVAIAGSLLLALLFVADATLKPRGPLFTNNSEGLTRSEPVRTQTAQRAPEAQRPQETPRPRAPALVPNAALQPTPAAKPVAPPIAEVAEAVEPPPAAAQAEPAKPEVVKTEVAKTETTRTEPAKTEPAKTEPARIEAAKLEAGVTEPAKSDVTRREAATAAPKEAQRETVRTAAPAPKPHKQVARKPERGSRYAAYRDGQTARDEVPTVDNGYPYGVAPRRERAEHQRPWGGEYGQSRFRF